MLLCNLTKAPLLTAYNLIVVVIYRHYFETIFTHPSHATIINQVHVRESKKNTYKRDIFIHLCKNPHTHTNSTACTPYISYLIRKSIFFPVLKLNVKLLFFSTLLESMTHTVLEIDVCFYSVVNRYWEERKNNGNIRIIVYHTCLCDSFLYLLSLLAPNLHSEFWLAYLLIPICRT